MITSRSAFGVDSAWDAEPSAPAVSLSIVTPCYNEQESLPELHRRVTAACQPIAGADYEIVLVDDGSADRTWQVIQALGSADPRVIGVHLMRNHGHQLAATAGLAVARGRRILLIDADLPELIEEMMRLMDEGADVVYGKRAGREGETWFKRTSAATFYRLLSRIANVPIPQDTGDFRLMAGPARHHVAGEPPDDRVAEEQRRHGSHDQAEPHREAQRRDREAGDGVGGEAQHLGERVLAPAGEALLAGVEQRRLPAADPAHHAPDEALALGHRQERVDDAPAIMTAIALFAGVQLLVLGVIGEYLGRLAQESKGRPLFLIDSIEAGGRSAAVPLNFSQMPRHAQERLLERLTADGG
jgi:dolichol-phosphate mannosyltransferase